MKKVLNTFTLLIIISFLSCSSSGNSISEGNGDNKTSLKTVTYTSTDESFANPERGFYTENDEMVSNSVSVAKLKGYRDSAKSLVQYLYYLKDFRDKELSTDILTKITNDMSTLREAGMKVILRFAYTSSQNEPDAPMDIILKHMEQLKPILQTNEDVIACVQAGFIGAWGEWYYSSNNLNNTIAYNKVIKKWMEVLPVSRSVQVRTPKYKQDYIGSKYAITSTQGFSGSDISRIGHHNDCLLASATDYGTYVDVATEKAYINKEGLYVPVGGETCPPEGVEPADCTKAKAELSNLRWSFLNDGYYKAVLDNWVLGGCMDEIINKLGYRITLTNGQYSTQHIPGSDLIAKITLQNDGYAPMYNVRELNLILRSADGKTEYVAKLTDDPRKWQPGVPVTLDEDIALPSDIAAGSYKLLMFLPDPIATIHDRPEYAVRLGNKDVWESTTGYNDLNITIKVDATGTLSKSTSSIKFIKK